jgi:UDP-N-acetylmuramyl pentapeptide phosphotransferase/UDP-N-acetylglucosamine-1-phosphate transferase
VVDVPNARSSHRIPIIRGGGLGFVAVILAGWLGLALSGAPGLPPTVLAGALAVAAISLLDDVRGVRWSIRLAVQALAVAAALAALPGGPVLADGLPVVVDRLILGLAWLWFVNLFNFMDGIDGLAGSEAACIGAGLALVLGHFFVPGPGADLAGLALLVAAAALGFLWWNWHPARIFLGDVGSVPLGYLIGWLLLGAAGQGAWVAALILPLYFLADATITLGRRLAGGHMPWHPHRTHFYQQALGRGYSHGDVVRRVILANAALMGLALVGEAGYPAYALGGAVAVVAALLAVLGRGAKGTE